MSTRSSAANLGQAVKDLSIKWDETRSYWRDVKSQEFERKHLDIIPQQVAQTIAVMEEVDVLLRKVRIDCE